MKAEFLTSGVVDILKERSEQIHKHNHTLKSDAKYTKGELQQVAIAIIAMDINLYPKDWNQVHWDKIAKKPRTEQLAIAGAFLAAEIDRLKKNT